MRNVTKCLSNIFINIANDSIKKQVMLHGISRTLYTDAALRLDKYIRSRRIVFQMFKKSNPILFKNKMAKLVAEESIINLDDIHATCCIINKNPGDINLLHQIVHKISEQNHLIDCKKLTQLGLTIMSTLHYVRGTDAALKMFMNPQYENIFCFPLTQLVLLDLLFESGRFQEVRQVYDKMNTMTLSTYFKSSVATLVAVSCYKENTPESLEYGLNFYKNVPSKNMSTAKVIAALGILALNQKAPEVALQLMEQHKIMNITHISIEIMALADLNKLDGVEKHLEFIKKTSFPELQCLSEEIVPKIKYAIKCTGTDETSNISKLLNEIITNGYVQKSIFNGYLLSPIKKERILFSAIENPNTENVKKLSETQ